MGVESQKTLWWCLSSAVALQGRSAARSCLETNNTTIESCQLEGQACRRGEEESGLIGGGRLRSGDATQRAMKSNKKKCQYSCLRRG